VINSYKKMSHKVNSIIISFLLISQIFAKTIEVNEDNNSMINRRLLFYPDDIPENAVTTERQIGINNNESLKSLKVLKSLKSCAINQNSTYLLTICLLTVNIFYVMRSVFRI